MYTQVCSQEYLGKPLDRDDFATPLQTGTSRNIEKQPTEVFYLIEWMMYILEDGNYKFYIMFWLEIAAVCVS